MRSFCFTFVICILFSVFFIKTANAQFIAPYQVRSIMFRMLNFFNDAVDDPSYNPTAPTKSTPQIPSPAPTGITGSCPFQATAFVTECTDYNCTQTKLLSAFDNNQQYGIANDLQVQRAGDNPDQGLPLGSLGVAGEVTYQDSNQTFPTNDGYNKQDLADIKAYLDANRDAIIDNDFEIAKKECDSFGSFAACPGGRTKFSSTVAPLDTIQGIPVDCSVNIRYGWFLRKKGLSPQSPTTTSSPAAPTSQQPTSFQNPTTVPTPVQSVQTTVQKIIDNITQQNIQSNLSNLVDDNATPTQDETQSRYSGSSGNETEATMIKSYFESLGFQTEMQQFSFSTGSKTIQTKNIIARIIGKKTNDVYLITAHMDSTSESIPTGPAPGADDNGSGTVAVMEAAAAFKKSGVQPESTLEFVLFSGEEQGLKGSYHYVSQLPTSTIVKGVFNLDMIGYNPSGTCIKFGYKSYNGDNVLSEAVVKANTDFNIGLNVQSVASDIDRSDHAPFWKAGKPAVFGYECNIFSNPNYHKTVDKTGYLNFDQITKTTKAVVGAVGQLSLQ